MSKHSASISWKHSPHDADASTYSRDHDVSLRGGQVVRMSASVGFKGNAECADPEQLFVSAVASCHMLTFLAIAELQGYRVESYVDKPMGTLSKSAEGKMAITRIVLAPTIQFSGDKTPHPEALRKIHAAAHKNCFIGNSVNTEVTVKDGT